MAKVHQPSKESDSEDFVIRLDPREWDGTFSGEGKGPNDGYDDDHTIDSIRASGMVLFQEKAKVLMMAMTMTIPSALIRASGTVLFQEKAKILMTAMMIISFTLIRVSGKVLSLHSRPRSRYWNPKLSMAMNF